MRVHLIKEDTIEAYMLKNARSKPSFKEWLQKLKACNWETTHDILCTFGSTDFIGNERVVFDIGGNNYRMICKYYFGKKQVHLYICWIGTHAEYDRVYKNNEQYTINIY